MREGKFLFSENYGVLLDSPRPAGGKKRKKNRATEREEGRYNFRGDGNPLGGVLLSSRRHRRGNSPPALRQGRLWRPRSGSSDLAGLADSRTEGSKSAKACLGAQTLERPSFSSRLSAEGNQPSLSIKRASTQL